jgi:hypothetical protein
MTQTTHGPGYDWVTIVVHGGGEVPFANTHPLVKFFSSLPTVERVYSVCLPMHGRNCISEHRTSYQCDGMPLKVALDSLFEVISPMINGRRVIIIG